MLNADALEVSAFGSELFSTACERAFSPTQGRTKACSEQQERRRLGHGVRLPEFETNGFECKQRRTIGVRNRLKRGGDDTAASEVSLERDLFVRSVDVENSKKIGAESKGIRHREVFRCRGGEQ